MCERETAFLSICECVCTCVGLLSCLCVYMGVCILVSVSVYGVTVSVSGVVPSCCELSNKEPNESDN